MSDTVNSLIDGFQEIRYNPALALSYFVKMTEEASLPSYTITNTNNPFIKALECAAVTTVGFNQEQLMHHRRLYPIVSETYDDLYYHMSDKDMINAFAYPSQCNFDIRFSYQEILEKLILDPATGYKKMIIPRDTTISVLGMRFTLQHPIEIRQMPHTGMQVVYIFDRVSPIETLTSNYVSWGLETIANIQVLRISVKLRQYAISSTESDVQASQGFVLNATYDDNFFLARAYLQEIVNGVKKWNELKVTYNPNIYDPNNPTVILRVADGALTASVPSVYTSKGLKGRMRLDVYTTKGLLSSDLAQVSSNDYTVKWTSIDKNEINAYSSVPESLRTLLVTSSDFVSGGRAALSYEELRQRVIDNSYGQKKLPVTPNDIATDLNDLGYEVRLQLDNVTKRTFVAAKPMYAPKDPSILTPASSTCMTLNVSLKEAALAYGAYSKDSRVSLTDKCLYTTSGGLLKVLNSVDAGTILNKTSNELSGAITNGQYYYSPFTYVLDASEPNFDLRAYYMNSPTVLSRSFVAENITSGHQAGVSNTFSISRDDTGYTFDLTLSGADETLETAQDDIEVQLSFISSAHNGYVYKNAVYMGLTSNDEHWYQIKLNTQYDINKLHEMDLKDFSGLSTAQDAKCLLTQKFNIITAIRNVAKPANYTNTFGDVYTQDPNKDEAMTLSHEIFEIKFGAHMDTLWRRSRSVYREKTYLKRTTNLQKVYAQDVYQMFDGLPFKIVEIPDGNGGTTTQVVETVLHHAGEPIFDQDGLPVYEYKIGDTVIGENGMPVLDPSYEGTISRLIDIYLVDGHYYFVNEPIVSQYRQRFTQELVQWIEKDLEDYEQRLLEQTNVYFYPKVTSGPIDVYTELGTSVNINSEQKFTLKLSIREYVYKNNLLIKELESTTIKQISQYLLSRYIISSSELLSILRSAYGQDVVDVQIKCPAFDISPALTLADDTSRMSIKKRLSVGQDNKIYLTEDVVFDYVIH